LTAERDATKVNAKALKIGRASEYQMLEPRPETLALQLPFLNISESMGNHDSKIVGADSVD